jgi:nucleotide-binding universal stress UspA family protein
MKTILVPTEDINAIGSALETALILARRCDSYIEGFALRWEIAKFTEADHREIARMEVQARATFESFMRKRGVPRSTMTTDTPSFGWLENAPAGDAFVGSHGRIFDVIVMNRSDRNATEYLRRNRIGAELKKAELDGGTTGETILATAQSLGCDLLIKGAYTQSRLRQMIFGGATQYVLDNAMIPVLLAN